MNITAVLNLDILFYLERLMQHIIYKLIHIETMYVKIFIFQSYTVKTYTPRHTKSYKCDQEQKMGQLLCKVKCDLEKKILLRYPKLSYNLFSLHVLPRTIKSKKNITFHFFLVVRSFPNLPSQDML